MVLGGICGIVRIEVVESHKMAEAEELQIKIMAATCELNESPQIKTEAEKEKKPGFAVPAWRRDFKISGQIGDVSQKDRLSFSSLIHQVENGLNRGYKEKEVIEAVIKAINPALRLRSYLEGKPDLTLAKVRRILRSHYQERQRQNCIISLDQLPRDRRRLLKTS